MVFHTKCWGEHLDLKKKEVTGWKKFHHDELLIYTLHLILKVIKLRRMRWAYQWQTHCENLQGKCGDARVHMCTSKKKKKSWF